MTDRDALDALPLEDLRRELDARAPDQPVRLASAPSPLSQIATADLVGALRVRQRGVYGVDDRKDHYEITEVRVADNTESTVALFDAADVVDNGDGTSSLPAGTFQVAQRLCASERFKDQPCGAFCSGFLVAPDLVATAGHCVDPRYLGDPTRLRFVFGYRMSGPLSPTLRVPNTDVYRGTGLVAHRLTEGATDWAVVRLDRSAAGRPALPLRREGRIADGAPVYVLGHPCGLPLKYAPGATVRRNAAPACFTANLDTYGGNSGSPVFSATHEVEGILVRGDTDFVWNGSCRVSTVFPTTGGHGEDVTRIAEILAVLPQD
jgi:hypothetical protein